MSMCMVHAWVGGSPASGVREVARHGWALESGPAARATLILDPYSCTDTGNGLAGSAVGCHIASSTIAPGSPGAPYEPRVPAICTINGRRWSRSCGGSSLTKPAWHSAPRADGGCAKRRTARPTASSNSSSRATDAGATPLAGGRPGGAEGGSGEDDAMCTGGGEATDEGGAAPCASAADVACFIAEAR